MYDLWHWFPHVLCRLWPIGLAANYLGVITRRGRTRMVWLWPEVRELSKLWYLDFGRVFSCITGYLIIVMMYVVFISSPYLLVFGDDRVRGTREQRMLMQVESIRLSHGAWEMLGSFIHFCIIWVGLFCKLLWEVLLCCFSFINYGFCFYPQKLIEIKFSAFLGNEVYS